MCERYSINPGCILQAVRDVTRHNAPTSIRDCTWNHPSFNPCSSLIVVSQICWYLAAVVQTQLCKYFIEIGDTAREQTVWGEINALRSVSMCRFEHFWR